MVRIFYLKPRTGHAIDASDAIASLLRLPHPPLTPPCLTNPSSPTNRVRGVPRRRWEKGLTPKKIHHPPASGAHRHSNKCRSELLKHAVINFRCHPHGSIQWLHLRHCFLHAYFATQKLQSETHKETSSIVPIANFVLSQIQEISRVIDRKLQAIHDVDRHLDTVIAALTLDDDSALCAHSSTYTMPLMTSNCPEIDISKSGPPAQ
jgi:hypothetical protein